MRATMSPYSCDHQRKEPRWRTRSNGTRWRVWQCVSCGKKLDDLRKGDGTPTTEGHRSVQSAHMKVLGRTHALVSRSSAVATSCLAALSVLIE